MMATPGVVTLLEGIRMSAGDGVAPEETLDLGLPDRMMAMHGVVLSLWGFVFGAITC
jgi:hypothetical protein